MNFLHFVPVLIDWGFYIYQIVLFIYILMSWVPQAKGSPIGMLIEKLVEPYLSIFRRFIPPIGMIDFSPIVAFIALQLVKVGVLTIWYWIITLL